VYSHLTVIATLGHNTNMIILGQSKVHDADADMWCQAKGVTTIIAIFTSSLIFRPAWGCHRGLEIYLYQKFNSH
jgi:hypothetical protein